MNAPLPQPIPARTLTGQVMPPGQKSLADRAVTIREADRRALQSFSDGLAGCIAAGKELIAAKAECTGRGAWKRFVNEQCQMTMTRSQRYIRLAKSLESLEQKQNATGVPQLSQRKALALLTATKRRKKKEEEKVKPQGWEV
jgi:hypothetical protein